MKKFIEYEYLILGYLKKEKPKILTLNFVFHISLKILFQLFSIINNTQIYKVFQLTGYLYKNIYDDLNIMFLNIMKHKFFCIFFLSYSKKYLYFNILWSTKMFVNKIIK